MEMAFDKKLNELVFAYKADKNSVLDKYRYECQFCKEFVQLRAANSQDIEAHFSHLKGNNNTKCENYSKKYTKKILTTRFRNKNDFYFFNSTNQFKVAVKYNYDEINMYEENEESLKIKNSSFKTIFSTLILKNKFLPDEFEYFPINEFSWEYHITPINIDKKEVFNLFHKTSKGLLCPSFFKIQSNDVNSTFKAKLIQSNTLYTNVSYAMIFINQDSNFGFRDDIAIDQEFKFKTMDKDFLCVIFKFINKTALIDKQLDVWEYKLESKETLVMLWPPSTKIDETIFINTDNVYFYSSFDLEGFRNINISSDKIKKLGLGLSNVPVIDQINIFNSNIELIIAKQKNIKTEYDIIEIEYIKQDKYKVLDSETYLFNSLGVFHIAKGNEITLTTSSELRQYNNGYINSIITRSSQFKEIDSEYILDNILKYYKKIEQFKQNDFNSLKLSNFAVNYLNNCSKTGYINSVAKNYIINGYI
jgi:hypothetical protein